MDLIAAFDNIDINAVNSTELDDAINILQGALDACPHVQLPDFEGQLAQLQQEVDAVSSMLGSVQPRHQAAQFKVDISQLQQFDFVDSDSSQSSDEDGEVNSRGSNDNDLAPIRSPKRPATPLIDASVDGGVPTTRFSPDTTRLPPVPAAGDRCLAVHSGRRQFLPATVLQVAEANKGYFTVVFDCDQSAATVNEQCVAYWEPAEFRLEPGFRVAVSGVSAIIASTLSQRTKWRYLMFTDAGTPHYKRHGEVRLLVLQRHLRERDQITHEYHLFPFGGTAFLPDDPKHVDPKCRFKEFLLDYMKDYPNNKRVNIRETDVGKHYTIRVGSEWRVADLLAVDCDLVCVRFRQCGSVEWLYKSSPRFLKQSKESELFSARRRLHPKQKAFDSDPSDSLLSATPLVDEEVAVPGAHAASSKNRSQWARKGTGGALQPVAARQSSTKQQSKVEAKPVVPTALLDKGYVTYHDTDGLPPQSAVRRFVPHQCSAQCIGHFEGGEPPADNRKFYNRSPFLVPLLLGWRRRVCTFSEATVGKRGRRKKKAVNKWVAYVAPCGRSLRTQADVTKYLTATYSMLPIDAFSFDPELAPTRRMRPPENFLLMRDLSMGAERMVAIPVVNQVDGTPPPKLEYTCRRFAATGTELATASHGDYCAGCQCVDDCSNVDTCACRKITKEEALRIQTTFPDNPAVAYKHSRLHEFVWSGVYECNEKCSCSRTLCSNRVAQRTMRSPMELFYTGAKGWGVRALVDMEAGQFVSVYSAAVRTSKDANLLHGEDAYFADLDLIDRVEEEKADLLGTAADDLIEADMDADDEPEDQCVPISSAVCAAVDVDSGNEDDLQDLHSTAGAHSPASARPQQTMTDDAFRHITSAPPAAVDEHAALVPLPDPDREVHIGAGAMAHTVGAAGAAGEQRRRWLLTDYFGDDQLFVLDAKSKGNLGRFFNHSHEPNLFPQNCLVDTHDTRVWDCPQIVIGSSSGSEDESQSTVKPEPLEEHRRDAAASTSDSDGEQKDVKADKKPRLKTKHPKRLMKRRLYERDPARVKPDPVADRRRERALVKVATQGVVQLFNAVSERQSALDAEVRAAGASEFRRDKARVEFRQKDDFGKRLDKAAGQSSDVPEKRSKVVLRVEGDFD